VVVIHPATGRPDDRSLSVLIVDADRRVRHSLSGLIDLADGLSVAGSAADPVSAIAILERGSVDICLIDPRLPDIDAGIALMTRLHHRWPDLALVAMGTSDAIEYPAMACGAVSFVAKAGQPDDVVDALRSAGRLDVKARYDAECGR
jgi:DNA-binding NarL/FixJ family response regulator